MKKVLLPLLLLVVVFASCGNSKQKELIADHEQTILGTKVDLGLKVNKLKKVKDFTSRDSLDILLGDEKETITIDSVRKEIADWERFGKELEQKNILYKDSVEMATKDPKSVRFDADFYEDMIESNDKYLANASRGIAYQKKLEGYFENPDRVLGHVWECTYTVKNPFLGGAKQEVTKTFLFNADDSEIITVLKDEE